VQNVRFWHKADIMRLSFNVRFWGVKRPLQPSCSRADEARRIAANMETSSYFSANGAGDANGFPFSTM
jgi:hypothetical protein